MRMRGLAPLLATALLLGGALATPAQAALPSVKVVECETGKTPEMRTATFLGRMRGGKGVVRMAMRFQLMEKTPGAASPQTVDAPALTRWRKSRVGVKDFSYGQTINGLQSGVTYSVRVHYRWYNLKGKVVRRAERESGTCVQDGALPNLVIGTVRIAPGSTEKTAVYTVSVGNTGQGEAKSVPVSLVVDGALVDTRTIDQLKAGEFQTVKFTGPHCTRLRAIADRGENVPETVEEDNELRVRC